MGRTGRMWAIEHQKAVTDVRGVGLMIGVEFRSAELAQRVQLRAFESGLLVLECGESSIRVSPPLVITRDQAGTALRVFGQAAEAAGA
jgi:4-aminobutyrate aminotransferase